MIVGTAGHIDHGKTLLVGALTGVDTDRFREEKTRGISIDLGFAYMPTPSGKVVGFVDVPGHEGFIHNMLAGATGIDFVLLVVAADDGVMPQTREHLAIVDMLGIDRGLVVVSKADLVSGERLKDVIAEVSNLLADTGLAGIEAMAVSSTTGEGVDTLRDRLFAEEASFGERKSGGRFRLAVDRSFTLQGVGTVVTGTVRLGQVAVGDRVSISPSGRTARVRTIHAQDRPVERGQVGDRCALNLAGDSISKDAVQRGDFVLDPALHAPTDRIDAMLRLLPSETRPVRQWTPVRLHHAAAEIGARIVNLREEPIRPGEEVPIQLVLEHPIAATVGDRYVVRDTSARRTMGGGTLIDLRGPQRRRRSPERLRQLQAHAIADPADALTALLDCEPGYVDLTGFTRDRGLTEEEGDAIVEANGIVRLNAQNLSLGLSSTAWQAMKADLAETLARFHADNPNRQGMDIERLRLVLNPRLPREAFVAALRGLASDQMISLDGARVRLPGHSVSLAPQDERLWAETHPLITGDSRFAPPRVRDIAKQIGASEANVRRLMKLAVQIGWVTEVSKDEYLTREALSEIIKIIGDLSGDGTDSSLTAAAFRDRIGSGRSVAIRILEYFDREGLTSRHGDVRRMDRRRQALLQARFAVSDDARLS